MTTFSQNKIFKPGSLWKNILHQWQMYEEHLLKSKTTIIGAFTTKGTVFSTLHGAPDNTVHHQWMVYLQNDVNYNAPQTINHINWDKRFRDKCQSDVNGSDGRYHTSTIYYNTDYFVQNIFDTNYRYWLLVISYWQFFFPLSILFVIVKENAFKNCPGNNFNVQGSKYESFLSKSPTGNHAVLFYW